MTAVAGAREDGATEPPEPPEPPGLPMASPSELPAQDRASTVAGVPPAQVAEQPGTSPAALDAALPRVLKIVGSVVAPTTLLTALMYYFGWLEAAAFWRSLGTDVTVLELTNQDYLSNSVDGLLPPLIAVAGAALLALWFHQLLLRVVAGGTHQMVVRMLMAVLAIAGLVLVSLAMADFLAGSVFGPSLLEGRGLSLSIGVLLLAYAVRLSRLLVADRELPQEPRRAPGAVAVAEWGAVFILVSVGLFWAVGGYAIIAGMSRAQQFEGLLPSLSDVVVYSEKRLNLQATGIREISCQYPDAAYRFRYEGLKLLLRSGNQYLFLPAGWTLQNGAVIVIPRSDTMRLEFSPPGQVRSASC